MSENLVEIEEDDGFLQNNAEIPVQDASETTPLLKQESDGLMPTFFGFGPRRKPSIWWLAPPLFLFVLGGLMTFAPLSQVMLSWVCDYMEMRNITTNETMIYNYTPFQLNYAPAFYNTPIGSTPFSSTLADDDHCNNPRVQGLASLWFMVLGVCGAVPSLFAVPFYGWLSDKGFGRRNIMLFPILGSTIHMSILIVVARFKDVLIQNDTMLLVLAIANVLSGLFGSWSTLNMCVLSYIADTIAPDKRTVYIGRIEAVNFSAFIVGPLIGGFMVKWTGSNVTPFYFTLGLYLFVLFYIAIIVPDSKPPKVEKPVESSTFKDTMSAAKDVLGGANLNRTLVTVIMFLLQFKFAGVGFVFIMYTRLRFGWQAYEDGFYFALTASCRVLSLAVLMPLVVNTLKKFGVIGHEIVMIRTGLVGFMMALTIYALAKVPWMFAASACFLDTPSFALVLPTIRSVLSTSTSSSHQARVFSAVAFIETTAGLISPLIFGPLYKYLVQRGIENYVFWVCLGITASAVIVSLFLQRKPGGKLSRQDTIIVDDTDEIVV